MALALVLLLLLVQAVPVLACVVAPTQALAACCCDLDHGCTMGHRAGGCATADSCCAQAVGSAPALSSAAAHPDDRVLTSTSGPGAPPVADTATLIDRSAAFAAAHRLHLISGPRPAVPLYLRYLRLTL